MTNQSGLVLVEDSQFASDFTDVNVIAVPVLSDNDSGLCANPGDK